MAANASSSSRIPTHNFFHRHAFYGQNDDDQRFAFFSKAALEFMLKSNKHPDIIHCHDWQTGLVPVLLYEVYQHVGMTHPRVCYTLHNLQHQGVTGEHILRATGLNRHAYFFHPRPPPGQCQPRCHQPDERRHRVFQLRHDGFARTTPGRS